jgi:uncharacterized protein
MRISDFFRAGLVVFSVAGSMLASVSFAHALDEQVAQADSSEKRSPWAVFRFGFSAYKAGDKDEAVEAYRYAAENGQIGARWKLATMYAQGDGVTQSDYEAFRFYQEIVQQEVEPGGPDDSYVADALVALAGYLRSGIPGSPVAANPMASQEYYMRAAASYRHPDAQYEIGRMFLGGEGFKANVQQAARWLQLAAEKGHAGAEATLGDLLFRSGRVVRGLAMMTAALHRASPSDQLWIRNMQEEAFALAPEADRRTAIALAEDILAQGSN